MVQSTTRGQARINRSPPRIGWGTGRFYARYVPVAAVSKKFYGMGRLCGTIDTRPLDVLVIMISRIYQMVTY